MQNSKTIAREALKELLKDGREPTPEVYAEVYYTQAKKMGVSVEADLSVDKVLEMLDKEAREAMFNKPFKNKNELLIALIKAINALFFSKKNFGTSLDILKLLLRILATYPQKDINSLARGQLIEIDKLNAQIMQIWREHWNNKVKQNLELDIVDCLRGIEILSQFEIPNAKFQEWQSKARQVLKGKDNKGEQIQLFTALGAVIAEISQQAQSTQNTQDKQTKETQSTVDAQQESLNPQIPPQTPKKAVLQYKELSALPIDATTTLMGKEGMREVLNFAEDNFIREGKNYSVIVFGICAYDKLKERFGIDAAKKVLITLGRLLKQHSNASDLIAYYGEEEFLACLLEREKEEAIQFIRQLDKIVSNSKFMFQQMRIEISLSAQVSHRVEEKDLESMLKMSLEEFKKHRDSQGIIRYEE